MENMYVIKDKNSEIYLSYDSVMGVEAGDDIFIWLEKYWSISEMQKEIEDYKEFYKESEYDFEIKKIKIVYI